MAAYAALVSLLNTMEQIQNHPHLSTTIDRNLFDSLGEKVGFFLDFIEFSNYSHKHDRKAEDLEGQIASAALAAEDLIESHIVDRIYTDDAISRSGRERVILAGSTGHTLSFLRGLQRNMKNMDSINFLRGLQRNMKNMDSIKKKMIKARSIKDQQPKHPMSAASSRPLTAGKTVVVGFDGYLVQLLDWLARQQSDRQIIPIIGMGGIGKTTLARMVYENSLIMQHFDVRAWATVSQEHNVREILTGILSCLGESTSNLNERTEDELGGQLHKVLFRRRYLIILDDMWSMEAWNKISLFFPQNDNGSRIIVTTRQSSVADHFGSLGLALSFLNDDESWSLFCAEAFEQGDCSPELEIIGREIVKKCRGLPLSIVLIGGLLRQSCRVQESWDNVAKQISSFLNSGAENQCMDILSLSYSHLPACMKPCFLHLGIFPEDSEIRVSLLVKLWVAEGFLKPNGNESLEEIAEGYVNDLVGRNLIIVGSLKMNGKTRSFYIHDLLRELCLRTAEKEKLYCVSSSLHIPSDINRQRRIIIRRNIVVERHHTPLVHTLKSTSLSRTLICEQPTKLLHQCRFLRVLIAVDGDSMDAAFQQVNLRFFACQHESAPIACLYRVPIPLSRLWNVQTLIMTKGIPEVDAPSEIWEMQQLRHLKFNLIRLPDPPQRDEEGGFLRNLQTLKTVLNFRSAESVCVRIPNIKKLRILYGNFWGQRELGSLHDYCLHNVGSLNKLESLKCSFYNPNPDNLLQRLSFPTSLKKLTLENCGLHWSDLTTVGSLPRFEVLKLYNVEGTGPEWNPVEGEFLRLKLLGIYGCSQLICWNADSSHFPVLEKLVIERLWKLNEIPLGIGEIPTLERICVHDCSISAALSAVRIQMEQEDLENHGLQVEVDYSMRKDLLEFRKRSNQQL